jgi:hypothetical protein
MSKEKNSDASELVFGPNKTAEGDEAIARMMFGKNAEKVRRTLPLLFALWGIDIRQKDDEE